MVREKSHWRRTFILANRICSLLFPSWGKKKKKEKKQLKHTFLHIAQLVTSLLSFGKKVQLPSFTAIEAKQEVLTIFLTFKGQIKNS